MSSAQMLMNNLNSTTLDFSKKSLLGDANKKISFTNSIEETNEYSGKLVVKFSIDSSKTIINPKVMEVWLNDILGEAQDLGLKS